VADCPLEAMNGSFADAELVRVREFEVCRPTSATPAQRLRDEGEADAAQMSSTWRKSGQTATLAIRLVPSRQQTTDACSYSLGSKWITP
jgi:hypothetical protein